MIGWKLNQLGLVKLTNTLVDMCLTNVLVKLIGYLFNQCDWLDLRIGWKRNQLGLVKLTNTLVDMCLTLLIGWKLNQLGLVKLTNTLVDMCLTHVLVK